MCNLPLPPVEVWLPDQSWLSTLGITVVDEAGLECDGESDRAFMLSESTALCACILVEAVVGDVNISGFTIHYSRTMAGKLGWVMFCVCWSFVGCEG